MNSFLEDQEFYELLQKYRHLGLENQSKVFNAYEKIKDYIQLHTLSFAEWINLNCVRVDIHEWTYRKDPTTAPRKVRNTNELFDIYYNNYLKNDNIIK